MRWHIRYTFKCIHCTHALQAITTAIFATIPTDTIAQQRLRDAAALAARQERGYRAPVGASLCDRLCFAHEVAVVSQRIPGAGAGAGARIRGSDGDKARQNKGRESSELSEQSHERSE